MDRTIDVHVGRLRDKLADDADGRATSPRCAASATAPRRHCRARVSHGPRHRRSDLPRGAGLGRARADDPRAGRAGRRRRHVRAADGRGGRHRRRTPARCTTRPSPTSSSSRSPSRWSRASPSRSSLRAAWRGRWPTWAPRRGAWLTATTRSGCRARARRRSRPRRLLQPDGGQHRRAGADQARLHRQRRARAAHAADQPAGLPRGAARRRDRGRRGDLRVAVGGGRPPGATVALTRCAGRRRRAAPSAAQLEEVDLSQQIRSAVELAEPAIERAGLTSTVDVPDRLSRPGQPRSPGPGAGQPVVQRRALQPAGGSIAVRAERRPADLLVSVINSGDGIPPADLGRVFERFYRVEKSRDRAQGGAGIGLAIVKQLVEAAGGRVGAETATVSTRFWFSLSAYLRCVTSRHRAVTEAPSEVTRCDQGVSEPGRVVPGTWEDAFNATDDRFLLVTRRPSGGAAQPCRGGCQLRSRSRVHAF